MPPPACKLTTTFVACRCGNHDAQNDQALKPAVLPYVPATSRAFDVLVLSSSHIGGVSRSAFTDMGGSEDPADEVAAPSSSVGGVTSPSSLIASLVVGVVVPDLSTNGTSLKLAKCHGLGANVRGEAALCKPVGSGHGIVAIHRVYSPPTQQGPTARQAGGKAQRDTTEEEAGEGLSYLLVDALGNVYLVRNILGGQFSLDAGTTALPTPELIIKSADSEPSPSTAPLRTHLTMPTCSSTPAGTPSPGGWIGVAFPSSLMTSSSHTTIRLPNAVGSEVVRIDCSGIPSLAPPSVVGSRHPYFAVGREYGKDVRVAEMLKGGVWSVTAEYNCIHAPTSLVYAGVNDEVLAVADGPLLTVIDADIRCASGNDVGGEAYFATTPRTLCHPLGQPKNLIWSVVSLVPVTTQLIQWALDKDTQCTEKIIASKSSGPRAPPSDELRTLSSQRAAFKALSQVLPNCIVIACSDRSVTVIDVRKWTKVGSVHNVLKYDALSMAIVVVPGGGMDQGPEEALLSVGCVVSGIDSEVRCVPCLEGSSIAHSLHQQAQAPNKKNAANGKLPGTAGAPSGATATPVTNAAGAPDGSVPAVSSFRGRINSAIHGEDLWHGGWHSISVPRTTEGSSHVRASVGLTATMQLYFAVAEHTDLILQ